MSRHVIPEQEFQGELGSIISSSGELGNFIDSSIHRDFLAELDVRISYYKECLVDQNVEFTGREYDVFRGFITNLRHVRGIFEQLKDNKQRDEEESENGEKEAE